MRSTRYGGKRVILLRLSERQERELEKIRRKTDDPRNERALAVLLNAEGLSAPKIALRLKRHFLSVRAWLKRFAERGIDGLSRDYSPGRPSVRNKELIPRLERWLCESPEECGWPHTCWTVKLIIAQYNKETGTTLSEDTVERALRDAGFSYKRPKKTVPQTAPTPEEKKAHIQGLIEELKAAANSDDAEIMALDETHFSNQPYLIKGWHKKGAFFPYTNPDQTGERHRVWCVQLQDRAFLLEVRRTRLH